MWPRRDFLNSFWPVKKLPPYASLHNYGVQTWPKLVLIVFDQLKSFSLRRFAYFWVSQFGAHPKRGEQRTHRRTQILDPLHKSPFGTWRLTISAAATHRNDDFQCFFRPFDGTNSYVLRIPKIGKRTNFSHFVRSQICPRRKTYEIFLKTYEFCALLTDVWTHFHWKQGPQAENFGDLWRKSL